MIAQIEKIKTFVGQVHYVRREKPEFLAGSSVQWENYDQIEYTCKNMDIIEVVKVKGVQVNSVFQ